MKESTLAMGILVTLSLIGIIFFALGIKEVMDKKEWLKQAQKVEGEVIELNEKAQVERFRSNQPRPTSTVIMDVRYEVDGLEYWAQVSSSLLSLMYKTGDKVEVYYHPKTPQEGECDLFLARWPLAFGLFLMGLLFIGIGIIANKMIKA